jgi:hypothetical protein
MGPGGFDGCHSRGDTLHVIVEWCWGVVHVEVSRGLVLAWLIYVYMGDFFFSGLGVILQMLEFLSSSLLQF